MTAKTKILNVIGMMSGTSLDGVDAALISTDGHNIHKIYQPIFKKYPEKLREDIKHIFSNIDNISARLEVAEKITLLHAKTVVELLETNETLAKNVDLIGFHGQTIYHNAKEKKSIQIGDPQLLAKKTGIAVISNLRDNDIINGGQGAPIVPIYHQAIIDKNELPAAVINIGGVSNITAIYKNKIIAGDIGPGNALLDDWMKIRLNKDYDKDGNIASLGKINKELVNIYISEKYFFKKHFPKSLDRNEFADFHHEIQSLRTEDGAATLTFLTAAAIAKSLELLPEYITKIILTGGGRKNLFLHTLLKEELNLSPINIDEYHFNNLKLDGDFIEAEAMAFIAARSFYKLPYTFPDTTGVKQPMSGGVLYP